MTNEAEQSKPTVTVDAAALREVLQALVGPSHLIRELQVLQGLDSKSCQSPIDTLIEQYNSQVSA